MKLIRGIHNLSQAPHGCVLTIGNFDGVHRGHQALLQGLSEEGRTRALPVVVMIFEPQPLELFAGDKAPARLTRLREKCACWPNVASITYCAYVLTGVLPR
jgi:riboflavin kinase/FMN adenylyltransferase